MPEVVIDGVEYVPKVSISPPADEQLLACLRELVSIQYFRSETHKHRAWAWDALNAIAPELAKLAVSDPTAAFEQVHGSDDDDSLAAV